LVEKARWGRSVITKENKIELSKRLMLQNDIGRSQEMIAKKTPAKKWLLKAPAKAVAKTSSEKQ
jgi:hypothetical protein